MATPESIRAGIAAAIKAAITGVQVSEYVLANPTAPGFEVDLDPEGISYDEAMGRGLDEWWFLVRGFVADSSDIGAQKARDSWLASSGDGSVKAAVEVDRTLGGACSSARVVSAQPRNFTTQTAPNTTYTGAEWRVRVMAPG